MDKCSCKSIIGVLSVKCTRCGGEMPTGSQWISVEDRLPEDGQNVLVYAGNYIQSKKIFMATFIKGISEEDRELMRKGVIPYEVSVGYDQSGIVETPRYKSIHKGDEHGNNQKPYVWNVCPLELFGQDVTHWKEVEKPEVENKTLDKARD